MDIGRIFSRSFELVWKYKFLWLFGFIMGLTSAGGNNLNYRNDSFTNSPFNQGFRIEPAVLVIAIIVGLILLIIGLILFFYFRFVARGALVSAVQDIETRGTSTLRDAWKQGRTYYARLLGLGFLVNVPLILFSIVILLIAIVPFLGFIFSAQRTGDAPRAILTGLGITGILGICCAVLCLVVLHFVIHPLYEFAVRAIVLEDLGVMEGLRRGIQQAREHLGNVIVVYLLLMGARLGWALIIGIIAVPVGLVLAVFAFGVLRADLNALIILILLAAIPLWLVFGALEGVFQTFESNVWTLAYRSLPNKIQTA